MTKKDKKKLTKEEKMAKPCRGFCFTLNNYTEEDVIELTGSKYKELKINYMIFGKEIGDEEQTPHLQGWLYIKKKVTMNKLKEILGNKYHFERQKGTIAEAIYYCMKQDPDYIEIGERPHQGKRTDLDLIRKDIIKGITYEQISDRYFTQWCFHRRAITEYMNMKIKYDTEIILYEPSSPKSNSQLIPYLREKHIVVDMFLDQGLWMKYYSKEYKYIITPYTEKLFNLLTINDSLLDPQVDNLNIRYKIVL